MKTRFHWFVLGLGLIAASAHAGQIYKWVDTDGRTHFSDTPQPGWKQVDVKPASGSGGAPADDKPAQGAAPANNSVPDPERLAELKQQECDRRRAQLQTYLDAPRIVERTEAGEEREYSQDERLQLIERTRAQVAELCGE